ncbi:MBL fold metallo-hydrolase [Paenibacillus sp. FJAT-26967]|uniref:MBL fold metallo-hydrolase n=1 Tax=Paenibacillus sp. FJAT-26967 TaxID=1729690 RepID=UPI000837C91A|nr:MBL fold metallo-hydrolase [Paenibacillus sp. FJAT-26967]
MPQDQGIKMLSISAEVMGKTVTIHPTVIWDRNELILVDTAYPGQFPLLAQAISSAGLSMERLSKVIISHQDLDHIGGLPAIKEQFPDVEVIASAIDQPYIQGDKRLLKLTPDAIAEAVNSLPEGVPDEWKSAFKHTLENPPKAHVDTTVANEEELPVCGGIIIIHTPGHTPGHLSLYHKASRTLIAADALIVEQGVLAAPDPLYCHDFELANTSIQQFLNYDIRQVICFHGGLYDRDCNKRIAELAEKSADS